MSINDYMDIAEHSLRKGRGVRVTNHNKINHTPKYFGAGHPDTWKAEGQTAKDRQTGAPEGAHSRPRSPGQSSDSRAQR